MNLLFAGIALVAGLIPGLFLFPALGSPFTPGIPFVDTAFGRIFHTIAQVIRGKGVLVKRRDNVYEIGIYDEENEQVVLSERTIDVDADKLRWALFGKRPFGVTWEHGTDFHQRIMRETATDGGGLAINMGAAHRYLRGSNEADAISRTEEQAKAEYGGGGDGFSDLMMAVFVIVVLLLGAFTTFFMV